MDYYIDAIDKLEVEVRVMREIKDRDEQLIRYVVYKQGTWPGS